MEPLKTKSQAVKFMIEHNCINTFDIITVVYENSPESFMNFCENSIPILMYYMTDDIKISLFETSIFLNKKGNLNHEGISISDEYDEVEFTTPRLYRAIKMVYQRKER